VGGSEDAGEGLALVGSWDTRRFVLRSSGWSSCAVLYKGSKQLLYHTVCVCPGTILNQGSCSYLY
jgi:hypothetical protein